MGVKFGVVLDPAKVQVARQKEIDSIARHEVVELVKTSECKQGAHVKGGWVEDNKGGHRPFTFRGEAGGLRPERRRQPNNSCAAHLPPLAQYRSLHRADLLWQRCSAVRLGHFQMAFLMDELVYVHPPRDMVPPGWCWKLRKSMCGTRRASRLWADYVRRVMEDDGSETIAVCFPWSSWTAARGTSWRFGATTLPSRWRPKCFRTSPSCWSGTSSAGSSGTSVLGCR